MKISGNSIKSDGYAELRLSVSAAKTAAYTVVDTDDVVLVDTTSAAITVTIPSALIATPGYQVVIKDVGAAEDNNITIATEGSETVNGAATGTIATTKAAMRLVSNGTNLFSI